LGLGTNPRDHLDPNLTIPKLPLSPESLAAVPYYKLTLKGNFAVASSSSNTELGVGGRAEEGGRGAAALNMPTPTTASGIGLYSIFKLVS
jgi:hypothetical protein